MLDAGHPNEAATRFEDPRRRAYADLKAGHYAAAAGLLAPFHDPESLYNRGNALARAGRLRAALDAYDAALKLAPDDRDTKHNRDLVARALRKRKHTGKQSNKRAGGKRSGNRSQAKQQNATAQAGNNGHRQKRSGRTSRTKSGGAAAQANSAGNPAKAQTVQHRATGAGERNTAKAGGGAAKPAAAARADNSKQQAERDAAQAARLQRQRSSAGSGKRPSTTAFDDAGAKPKTPKRPPKPETEQALSLDQWLRRIPDNPAGLLRRKFLIENALRRQNAR